VAQALIRREKDETRNKLNKKWNLSLEMRVGDDYSPALVFLREGNTAVLRRIFDFRLVGRLQPLSWAMLNEFRKSEIKNR
jgi:hypothetical protein